MKNDDIDGCDCLALGHGDGRAWVVNKYDLCDRHGFSDEQTQVPPPNGSTGGGLSTETSNGLVSSSTPSQVQPFTSFNGDSVLEHVDNRFISPSILDQNTSPTRSTVNGVGTNSTNTLISPSILAHDPPLSRMVDDPANELKSTSFPDLSTSNSLLGIEELAAINGVESIFAPEPSLPNSAVDSEEVFGGMNYRRYYASDTSDLNSFQQEILNVPNNSQRTPASTAEDFILTSSSGHEDILRLHHTFTSFLEENGVVTNSNGAGVNFTAISPQDEVVSDPIGGLSPTSTYTTLSEENGLGFNHIALRRSVPLSILEGPVSDGDTVGSSPTVQSEDMTTDEASASTSELVPVRPNFPRISSPNLELRRKLLQQKRREKLRKKYRQIPSSRSQSRVFNACVQNGIDYNRVLAALATTTNAGSSNMANTDSRRAQFSETSFDRSIETNMFNSIVPSTSSGIRLRINDAVPSTSSNLRNSYAPIRRNLIESSSQVNRATMPQIHSFFHSNGLNNVLIANQNFDQSSDYFRGDIISTNFDVMNDCEYSRYLNSENRAIRDIFQDREIVVVEDDYIRHLRALHEEREMRRQRSAVRRPRREFRTYHVNRNEFGSGSEHRRRRRVRPSSRGSIWTRANIRYVDIDGNEISTTETNRHEHTRSPDRNNRFGTRNSESTNVYEYFDNDSETTTSHYTHFRDNPNIEGPGPLRPRRRRRSIDNNDINLNNNSTTSNNNYPYMVMPPDNHLRDHTGEREVSERHVRLLRERHTSKHPYRMGTNDNATDEMPESVTNTERSMEFEISFRNGDHSSNDSDDDSYTWPENTQNFSDNEISANDQHINSETQYQGVDQRMSFPPVRNPLSLDELSMLQIVLTNNTIAEINVLIIHAVISVLFTLFPDVDSDEDSLWSNEGRSIRNRALNALSILARTAHNTNRIILDVLAMEYFNYSREANPDEPSTSTGRRSNLLTELFTNGHLIFIIQVIKERYNTFLRTILNEFSSGNTNINIHDMLSNNTSNRIRNGVDIMLNSDRFVMLENRHENNQPSRLLFYNERNPSETSTLATRGSNSNASSTNYTLIEASDVMSNVNYEMNGQASTVNDDNENCDLNSKVGDVENSNSRSLEFLNNCNKEIDNDEPPKASSDDERALSSNGVIVEDDQTIRDFTSSPTDVYLSCETETLRESNSSDEPMTNNEPIPSTSGCNSNTKDLKNKKKRKLNEDDNLNNRNTRSNSGQRDAEDSDSDISVNVSQKPLSDNVDDSNSDVDIESLPKEDDALSMARNRLQRIGLRGNMEEWYSSSLNNYEPLTTNNVVSIGSMTVVDSGDNNFILADNYGLGRCYMGQRPCEGIEPCDLPLNAEVVNPLLYSGPSYAQEENNSNPEDVITVDDDGNVTYNLMEVESDDGEELEPLDEEVMRLNDALYEVRRELVEVHSQMTQSDSEEEDNRSRFLPSTSSEGRHEEGCMDMFQGLCMCRNSTRNLLSYLRDEFSIERESISSLDVDFIMMILTAIRSLTQTRGENEQVPDDYDTMRRVLRQILRTKRWLRLADRNPRRD